MPYNIPPELSGNMKALVERYWANKFRGVPVGAPYTNPNWISPGLGHTPFNPYLLSNGGNVTGGAGGALVTRTAGGVPAALGPIIEGTATAVPEAAASAASIAAEAPAAASIAAKRSLLARAFGGAGTAIKAVKPLALPLTIAAAPLMNDPGSRQIGPDGEFSSNARMLDTQPDDTGIEELGKAFLRGTYDFNTMTGGALRDGYDSLSYFWKTQDEYKDMKQGKKADEMARKAFKAGMNPAQVEAVRKAYLQRQPKEGQALPDVQAADEAAIGVPMDSPSVGSSLAGGDYIIPKGNADSSYLDALLGVVAASKPTEEKIPDDLKKKLKGKAFQDALDIPGDYSAGSNARRLSAAMAYGDLPTDLAELQQKAKFNEETLAWAEKYAKTGIDVAKAKKDLGKVDMKIHSTKGGFLIESTDSEGNKVLKPLSGEIFGNKSGKKIDIMGSKFDADSALSQELGILQNLNEVGGLNDIFKENKALLEKAAESLPTGFEPKRLQEAQLTTLALAMKLNPQLKAQYIKRYTDVIGVKPKGAKLTPAPSNFSDALLSVQELPDSLGNLDTLLQQAQ